MMIKKPSEGEITCAIYVASTKVNKKLPLTALNKI